ncbi:hypothetical protein Tco_0210132 [Tanacetum coccineum]
MNTGACCTQGMVSSIPIVGSISPEGFLSLILLLVVIIATVVVMVVVVVAIVGVVIVVAVIGVVVVVGGVSFIIKLLFMVIGFFLGTILLYQESFKFEPGDLIGFFYSNRLGVFLGLELGLFVLAIVAACASRSVATLSTTRTKKYRGSNSSDGGDIGDGVKIVGEVIRSGGGIGDSIGVSVSLGGGISLGGKKFQELSIGGSDNTGDRGKMASEAKRYLDKLSEESGEMFLGEAGK